MVLFDSHGNPAKQALLSILEDKTDLKKWNDLFMCGDQ